MARGFQLLARAAAVVAALGAASGAALAAPPAPGTYAQAILSGGVSRHYILHIPPGFAGQALPVVFVLHGFGGSAAAMMASTGMNAKSDAEGFYVAYLQGMPCDPSVPDAPPNCSGVEAGWNTGISPSLGIVTDDVLFVHDVLIRLEGTLAVDRLRVYATGLSNGAMMTHRLGAELPDVLAAIAPVEGTIGIYQNDGTLLTTPAPVGPIPAIIVHGLNDLRIPYNGGVGGPPGFLNVLSVSDAVDFWRAANGCTTGPFTSPPGNVVVKVYAGCLLQSQVRLVSVGNGGHFWPTVSNTGFSATDAIWTFFKNHPLT